MSGSIWDAITLACISRIFDKYSLTSMLMSRRNLLDGVPQRPGKPAVAHVRLALYDLQCTISIICKLSAKNKLEMSRDSI
jgi:hypothetical protein